MARRRVDPLFEGGAQWIARDPGSPNLYRFWTVSGRTRRKSLGTSDLGKAKQKFMRIVGPLAEKEPDRARWTAPGIIYFVQDDATKFIKIGYTSNRADARMSQLGTGVAGHLKLLAYTPGSRNLEYALHKLLSDWRKRGEWFAPVPQLMKFIIALKRGEPPPKILIQAVDAHSVEVPAASSL